MNYAKLKSFEEHSLPLIKYLFLRTVMYIHYGFLYLILTIKAQIVQYSVRQTPITLFVAIEI
jgi:hypothetical protein